jgi:hypothetical protein
MRLRQVGAMAALALAGCGLGGSPVMRPGADCLHCHDGGRARRWTVAGTVFPSPDASPDSGILGAHVRIRDAVGWSFELRTNAAGNFYTAETVAFPLQVCVEDSGTVSCMSGPVETGGCNSCHSEPPKGGAAGRVSVP